MHTVTLKKHGWFLLVQDLISRLSLVLGEGGSGKTETILKIASLGASVYDRAVILIDAEGDHDLAARFVAAMRQAGKQSIKLFPVSPYDGWLGDPRALYNRLMAVQVYTEPYYEGIAQLVLDLALNAPGGPPWNSADLLNALRLDQLRLLYRGFPEIDDLERLKPEEVNGVYNRYRAFFKTLSGKLDRGPGAFTFDDTDAAYIQLDTLAFARECSSIGRYLVEDLAHYVTVRKPKERKVLIIIDEVSALAIENIANLAERFRSFGATILLTSQSEEGLAKTEDERSRILKASHMLVLHTCNTPERLIERAGKSKQLFTGWSTRDAQSTGYGTAQMRDEYIVPPDRVRRLDVGEVYILVQGKGYKVRVAPVSVSSEAQAQAQTFINQEAQASKVIAALPSSKQQSEEEQPPPDTL